jgi:phosphate starvation-inducible PhoH-like protein
MIEKIIYLEGIDPVSIYGINNTKLDAIKKTFPKIRIVARGHEIKVIGEEESIEQFEGKMNQLIEYYHKYNSLNLDEINELIHDEKTTKLKSSDDPADVLIFGNNGKPIKARTANQNLLVEKAMQDDLIFAIGPAGTGKTYTSIALAVRSLRAQEIKRIILTRPAVEAGEHLGFLPGDLKEKLDPYLQPLYDALHDMIPARKLKSLIEDGIIQIAPLAFMRGRTLDNAFVILDEAQNTTKNQFKMFLTRMGRNAKFIVNGDITQVDLPGKTSSGLVQALDILKQTKGISMVFFDKGDIIRHRLVKKIVDAYDREYKKESSPGKKS